MTEEHAPDLAPFVTTLMEVVKGMLELAGVTSKDVVYDLGSGYGRIVITAARDYGTRGVGLEIDPALVVESRENAREAGVEHLVEIRQEDILKADLSSATVVTAYLFPDANVVLRPILQRQLKAGARVISSQFDMGTWEPAASIDILVPPSAELGEETATDESDALPTDLEPESYTIFLWRITPK